MYTYKLIKVPSGTALIRSDGLQIPYDPTNSDYAAYLVWVNEGNVVTPIPAPSVPTLEQAQAIQIVTLTNSYNDAIQQPVLYTSQNGVLKQYQATAQSVANLTQMLLAFGGTQTTPQGFYWVAADNSQVAFTYADMQGLATTFGVQGAAAFQTLQMLKAQVNDPNQTVVGVQAVVWPTAIK